MSYTASYNPSFGTLGMEVAKLWPERDLIGRTGHQRDTLGLAISGGGYRSAIFGYGILHGLHRLGLLTQVDYLSAVSGGSWISMPFAMAEFGMVDIAARESFFRLPDTKANFMEEGFESLLVNPVRLAEEAALTRAEDNFVSDLYGRLLAKTFLREYGDQSRWKPLGSDLIRDQDRPFLIVNGTVNFRRSSSFDITQECFEMTRLYCGSRSAGYVDSIQLLADDDPIRIRDAIAMSGAAVAVHLPGLGEEVSGHGLSRQVVNYVLDDQGRPRPDAPANPPLGHGLDVADGGHYNNLGVESLVNRGCGFIIVVDAEHDPEMKTSTSSNQKYEGLRTLMQRNHIPQPDIAIATLDRADEPVHYLPGNAQQPDILYVKLKSSTAFDAEAAQETYNQPGFLQNLFGNGRFSFNPQFSTAKLDYNFTEHRNLTQLGAFVVRDNATLFTDFVGRVG
jgi:hypothetical protein